MKGHTLRMLEEILDSGSIEEVTDAMQRRLDRGIEYSYLKPKSQKKIIYELDKQLLE